MAAAIIMARKNQNEHGHRGDRREKAEAVFDVDTDKSQNIVIKPETVRRKGTLQKMVLTTEIVWQEREVTLTNQVLSFSNVADSKIIDYIPLADVTDAHLWGSSLQSSKHLRGKNGARGYDASRHSDDENEQNAEATNGFAFQITTVQDGHNSGRTYRLKAQSMEECDSWVADIQRWSKEAAARKQMEEAPGRLNKLRLMATQLYVSDYTQMVVATLIILNFIVNAASAEILPEDGTALARSFEDVEAAFTAVFTLELLVNLFVNWWKPFFSDSWNVFDLVVITASLLAFAFQDLPGFSLLRLIRVFRVLRVFRRLQSLRRIINALSASVMPMMNAFAVLFLVTAIYAILGVSLYRDKAQIHFGSFSSAMFTMFQVCTMDGWADEVARKLFPEDGRLDFGVAAFFVSFVIVVGIVILNVVVAVLLDEFVESVARDREERLEQKLKEKRERERSYGSPLDPVLAQLSQFNTSKDLSDRIAKLFQAIDIDSNQYLTADDLREGLRKMQFKPVVHLSEDDFVIMTQNRSLCDAKGHLTITEFEVVMREQLKLYVQRQMAQGMVSAQAAGSQIGDVLFVLKLLMITLEDLKAIALDEVAPDDAPDGAGHPPRLGLGDAFLSSSKSVRSMVSRSSDEDRGAAPAIRRQASEQVAGSEGLHDKLDTLIALIQDRMPPRSAPERQSSGVQALSETPRRLSNISFSVRAPPAPPPDRPRDPGAEDVQHCEAEREEEEDAMAVLQEMRERLDRFMARREGPAKMGAPAKMEVEDTELMVHEGSDWDYAEAWPAGSLPPSLAGPDPSLSSAPQLTAARERSVARGGSSSVGGGVAVAARAGMPVLFSALKKAPMAGISKDNDGPDASPAHGLRAQGSEFT